jgi:type VII secretion integral membrane protein EccD
MIRKDYAVANTVSGGLSRVTIVAPDTRMDLALPSELPLADLLPTLLFHAGRHVADEGLSHGGWALSRVGGAPLDSGRSAAQLEIKDGEILFLTPRAATAPEVVFDDVVDAVATATLDRPGRWTPATTRRFSVGFAATALLGGVAAVLLAGPPQLPGALAGIVIAGALLLAATLVSRVGGDSRTGALFGMVALAYGTVGGLLLLAGDRTVSELAAPDVLLSASLLLVLAATATIAVGDYSPLFLGAMIASVGVGVGAGVSLIFEAGPAVAAVIIACLVFAFFPTLPMLSYRLARLPMPAVPAGPEDLRADIENVDGKRVLELSDRANAFHIGLIGTAAVLVAGCVVVMVIAGGWRAGLLAGVLSLLLLLRGRPYRGTAARLAVLVTGAPGLAMVATAGFIAGDVGVRLGLVVGGLLVAAAASLLYGVGIAGRRISPFWGRLLDISEVLLIVAVVPLAAWIIGLYEWIATIRN